MTHDQIANVLRCDSCGLVLPLEDTLPPGWTQRVEGRTTHYYSHECPGCSAVKRGEA